MLSIRWVTLQIIAWLLAKPLCKKQQTFTFRGSNSEHPSCCNQTVQVQSGFDSAIPNWWLLFFVHANSHTSPSGLRQLQKLTASGRSRRRMPCSRSQAETHLRRQFFFVGNCAQRVFAAKKYSFQRRRPGLNRKQKNEEKQLSQKWGDVTP